MSHDAQHNLYLLLISLGFIILLASCGLVGCGSSSLPPAHPHATATPFNITPQARTNI